MSNRISDPKFLQGHWPLSSSHEVQGEVRDISGHNRHGIPTDLTYVDGPFGRSVGSFNGSSSVVQIPHNNVFNVNLESGFTVSAWGFTSDLVGITSLVSKRTNTDNTAPYILGLGGDSPRKINFTVGEGGSNEFIIGETLRNNKIYNLCGTIKRNVIYLYSNGVNVANSLAYSQNVQNNTENIKIGKYSSTTSFTNGKIWNVRIYNCALALDEVRQLYKLDRR